MMSIKDAVNIVVNTWGIDKTIKTIAASVATGAVAFGICVVAIPNSNDGIVIFTETEKEN